MILPVLLLLASSFATASVIKVANFQDDGEFTERAFLMYNKSMESSLSDFSFAFRIKLSRLRGTSNYILSYAVGDADNALTAAFLAKGGTSVLRFETCKMKRASPVAECLTFPVLDLAFQEWMHFAVTYEKLLQPLGNRIVSRITAYVDGQPVAGSKSEHDKIICR